MQTEKVKKHICQWLTDYIESSPLEGFIVGISGGIDSAVTSLLCAETGKKTILLTMPIRQTSAEYERALEHIADLQQRYSNVFSMEIDLTSTFDVIEKTFPENVQQNQLAMANTRARLRMTTLYAVGQQHNCLVAGTGNKVEDFGVGFYTKYGDGGVDISPIADLYKTDVWSLGKELKVVNSIQIAKPTDGLWANGRTDEDQIGASYPELEWAMEFEGDENSISGRQKEVLKIYRRMNRANQHKMLPIPVCLIPKELK